MPAPDAAIAAYFIVFGVPLLILLAYIFMYREIGRAGLTGGGLTEGEAEGEPEA